MKRTALTLALSLTFALSASLSSAVVRAAGKAPPLTHKTHRAKRQPVVETVRVGCPVRWETLPNADLHTYRCPATGVVITVPAENDVGLGYLDGSVKGDKDAGWYR